MDKKRVSWEMVEEAVRREMANRPKRRRGKYDPAPQKENEVVHVMLTDRVTVEVRKGDIPVRVETVARSEAFTHLPGAITQRCVGCSPAFRRKMDSFYDEVDRDLREWEFKRDLALGCPYAVRRAVKERRHLKAIRRMVKADAIWRGLV